MSVYRATTLHTPLVHPSVYPGYTGLHRSPLPATRVHGAAVSQTDAPATVLGLFLISHEPMGECTVKHVVIYDAFSWN